MADICERCRLTEGETFVPDRRGNEIWVCGDCAEHLGRDTYESRADARYDARRDD